jgi:hypothetical protein
MKIKKINLWNQGTQKLSMNGIDQANKGQQIE